MSSASEVEAFLAAKWKSKKIEMEDESDEQNEPTVDTQELQEEPNVSSINPQTPTKSSETLQNTLQKKIEYLAALQKFRQLKKKIAIIPNNQESDLTRTMSVTEDMAPKTANQSKDSFINRVSSGTDVGLDNNKNGSFDDENDLFEDGETERENIKDFQVQQGDSDEISNYIEKEDRTSLEVKTMKGDKVNKYYEMIGDVWGLLEQQNEDNEQEEEEMGYSERKTKEVKPAEPIDLVFGALGLDDINRISNMANSRKGQVLTETASGVPKMAIPFSNFGKLLEQPGNEQMKDVLIPKTLYGQRLVTNTVQHMPSTNAILGDICSSNTSNKSSSNNVMEGAEQVDKVIGRYMQEHQQFNTKPRPDARKMSRAGDMCHKEKQGPGFRTEGMEPHSTTKFRQTSPNSGEYQYLQTNFGQGTQTAIIEKNLNQRLLPHRTSYHNQRNSEVRVPRILESMATITYDPVVGPMGEPRKTSPTNPCYTKDGLLPIRRFNANLDPIAKTVTYNVVKYFQNRKHQFDLGYNEVRVASEATGMTKNTIFKILEEAHENIKQNNKPFAERKSHRLPKSKFSEPNVKRDCIARMFIHNSYLIKKEVPTLEKIIENCQQNGFQKVLGTTASCVRAHLKKLGFEYTAQSGNKKFLIERPDFIAQRIRHLEEMQDHREQKKNIVFVFIADMLKKGMKNLEWEGWDGVFQETEQGIDMGCVSVLHAASENFVFHDCLQVIEYKVNSHIDLPQKPFTEWLTTRLLPQVPKGSVIVLGDQRFHQMFDLEKRPHVGCTKEQIAGWLREHNMQCDDAWPKALLLERVQKVVLDQKYSIDDKINTLGYIPVHMPLHHRDLNPLSFLWQDIKDKLDNSPDVSSIRALRHFVTEEFTKAAIKLGKAWIQVEKLEKSYYNIDMHTDDEKEELILRYGNGLVPIDSTNEMEIHSSDDEENSDGEEPPNKLPKVNNPFENH